jgi:hypothetical protein
MTKVVLALIATTLLGTVSFAATTSIRGITVKTTFQYQNKNKSAATESTLVVDPDSKTWMTVAPPKDGIALLARIAESDSKTVQLEYIVVDTQQANAVVSAPQLKVNLGEAAKIEVAGRDDLVQLTLLATPIK